MRCLVAFLRFSFAARKHGSELSCSVLSPPFSLGEDDLPDLLLSLPFDFPQLDALVCHSLSSRLLCIGSWCKNSSIVSCTSEGLGDAGDCVSDVVADEIEFLRFLAQALD